MLKYNYDQKYIVFDFETEGLNLVRSRPFQLSWIECTLNGIISTHDYYIKWSDLNLNDTVKKLTHFPQEIYDKTARPPSEVLSVFENFLYNPEYKIVGQNILGYDIYIHNILRKACGFVSDYSYVPRILDTKLLSKAIKLDIAYNGGSQALWQYRVLSYEGKRTSNSQAALLKEFSIPHDPENLHNSLYDVQMTWEVFKKLIWKVEI